MKLKIKLKTIIIIVMIGIVLIASILSLKRNIAPSIPDLSKEHLVVYSCLRGEETKSILELFKEKTNCSYEYIQLPTQEAVSRIEDEKSSPKADIFLSGTGVSLKKLAKDDLIKRYTSPNDKNIPKILNGEYGNGAAFEVHPFSIVINKDIWNEKFKSKKIPLPESFEDLTNPKFKGEIALPNPLTSGTGHSFIAYLHESLGEKKYKDVISKIKNNTGFLSTRGYNVVQNVASGEYPIGVAYLSNIKLMEETTKNFIVITPKNTGVDIHGVGIINKRDNLKASEAFIDFILSTQTQKDLKKFSTAIPVINYENNGSENVIGNLKDADSAINIWKNIK